MTADAEKRGEEIRAEFPGVFQHSFQIIHALCQKIDVINQLINI